MPLELLFSLHSCVLSSLPQHPQDGFPSDLAPVSPRPACHGRHTLEDHACSKRESSRSCHVSKHCARSLSAVEVVVLVVVKAVLEYQAFEYQAFEYQASEYQVLEYQVLEYQVLEYQVPG